MHLKAQKVSRLTEWAIRYPKVTIFLTLLITIAFLTQFPKIKIDTDPKNMLPLTSDVRVYNDKVEKWFSLHKDTIVVGIVNEKGIFNQATLKKVKRITDEILRIEGVVIRDVTSFTTVDNVISENGGLLVRPLMVEVPKTKAEMEAFKNSVLTNPILLNMLISKDMTTTAIYVPLENGANGKEIADKIRDISGRETGDEQYYIAGDPVARDTFGYEMFFQMAIFSPIAGGIMFLALYLMFRNLSLALSIMVVAMVSITWSMGLLIGSGFTVHIMSSMIPIFLMAISTDSIHIFNEFYFRFRESRDKKSAILDTMRVVGPPVRYTALATAVGFLVLVTMHIIPVRVFGFFVAFGTVVIRLMSFSFIPAVMMIVNEERLISASDREDEERNRVSLILRRLGKIGLYRSKGVVIVGLLLLLVALIGISRVNINNNMVSWFKENSEIRRADRIMNERLGGTSMAYIVAASQEEDFMKRPEVLRYIEGLQRHLEGLSIVGKTRSVIDYVKRINRVLHQDNPEYEVVPASKEIIAQYLFLFSMSAKPSDLDNVIDYPFQKANIWVQLKTWNADAMRDVIDKVKEYTLNNPMPGLEFKPAGIAYFNMVWNDEVLYDMIKGFALALILVFIILTLNFRSIKWGLISYIPLLFTILLIYGFVGFIGKDFDMPISVLSTLSLGMAVDFAIHYIGRFHQRYAEDKGLEEALLWTAARPGKGIMRNALLFSLAFSVMVFATLTPYITVGLFITAIMMISALLTIIFLTAIINLGKGWLLKERRD